MHESYEKRSIGLDFSSNSSSVGHTESLKDLDSNPPMPALPIGPPLSIGRRSVLRRLLRRTRTPLPARSSGSTRGRWRQGISGRDAQGLSRRHDRTADQTGRRGQLTPHVHARAIACRSVPIVPTPTPRPRRPLLRLLTSRSLQGLPGTTHSLGCPVATTAITGCALAIQPSSRRCVAIGPSGELIVLAATIAGKPSPNQ